MSKMENARTPEDCKTGYKTEKQVGKQAEKQVISFETLRSTLVS